MISMYENKQIKIIFCDLERGRKTDVKIEAKEFCQERAFAFQFQCFGISPSTYPPLDHTPKNPPGPIQIIPSSFLPLKGPKS